MSWNKTEIDLPLLNGINDILDTLNSGASTLEGVLNTSLTALDAAKIAYLASSDPFSFLFEELLTEVENLINDIFNANVSFLVCNPLTIGSRAFERIEGEILDLNAENIFSFEDMQVRMTSKNIGYTFDKHGIPLLTPSECINAMVESFDDTGDPNRPQLSDSSEVAAFGLIATAPALTGFIPLVSKIIEVFNLKPLVDVFNEILRKSNLNESAQPQTTLVSTLPDWTSARLSMFDALAKQRDQLLSILNLVRGYVQTADQAVLSLIDTLERKINNLLGVIEDFNQLVLDLKSVANASGVWSFSLPKATGGVNLIKKRLLQSADDPDNPNANIFTLNSGYSIGVLVVGGGASLSAVETIRELMFETAEILNGEFFDEIQVVTFSNVPTSGSWRLEFLDESTIDLPFDAKFSTVQKALNDLDGINDIEVQGDYNLGFTIRFRGSMGNQDQSQLSVDDVGASEIQKITFTGKPTSGSFNLRYNPGDGVEIEETAAIGFEATAAIVQDRLQDIFGFSSVAVTGSYTVGFTVTWLGSFEYQAIPLLSYSNSLNVGVKVESITKGRLPASNLLYSSSPVTIEIQTTREGQS